MTENNGEIMTMRAEGTFEVTLTPAPPDEGAGEKAIGRLTIDKTFSGDLEGTSRGEMLAVRSDVQGSAGYVAIERVTGTLHGRSGTFALQHNGIMTRGAGELTIVVVPDSGTGELAGLAGRISIAIDGGRHSYDFEYELAEPA